jgi:hypothetical protein
MCFPKAPQPVYRDPNAEAAATLLSQLKAERGIDEFAKVGPRINIEREYRPQYTQLEIDTARQALYGDNGNNGLLALMRESGPELAAAQRDALSAQRAGDIADVQALAGASRSAYDQLNPEGAALLRRINSIRQEELDNPYAMTSSQRREAEQNVRAAQASRGLGYGPTDAFTEALYLGDRGRGLFNERMQGAAQTIGLNQAFYGDPFQQILGRPGTANPQGLVQQAQAFAPGQVFDPYSAYFGEAYASNANAANAANIAGANNKAAVMGSIFSGLGSLGGGGLSALGRR